MLRPEGPVLVVRTKGPVLRAEGPVLRAEGSVLRAEGPVLRAEGPVLRAEGPVLGCSRMRAARALCMIEHRDFVAEHRSLRELSTARYAS